MDDNIEKFQREAVEYLELVEQLGIQDRDTSEFKRRTNRRFNFNSPEKTILIQIGDEVGSLYDLSVRGLSFYSMKEHTVGMTPDLDFDGRYHVGVVIVRSYPVTSVSNDDEIFFRHSAKFINQSDGFKCMAAILRYFTELIKIGF